jgi:hypothetical protein
MAALDADPEVEAALVAVQAARANGEFRSCERSAELGGRQLTGWPLRWIQIDRPPAIHFPDACRRRSVSARAFGALYLIAFVALVFAVVSAATTDWTFLAGFAAVSVVAGLAGYQIDRRVTPRPERVPTGIDGLTLLPDVLALVDRTGATVLPRHEVVSFGTRQTSPPAASQLRSCEFVEARTPQGTTRIDLQPWVDDDQRRICQDWLHGDWPPQMPV